MPTRAVIAAGVVLPAAVFSVIAVAVSGDPPLLDRRLVELSEDFYEHELAWNATTVFVRASSVVGAALAAAALAFLLRRRLRRAALFWALAIGGALLLDLLLKAVIRRPGIGAASDEWSFPSGNAMASAAIALAVVVLLARSPWQRPAALLGALVLAVEATGVVVLGWHYATDVLGGWLAALAWISALLLGFGRAAQDPADVG